MQRPRRTSEFPEEPGTANKRNSRHQQRTTWAPSPAPSTISRYTTRQSRIARPSSTDRQTLGFPLNSALRGSRTTPQKTPTPGKASITRVLFTAEKERNAHNDKRWVQEKAQQIVEHLRDTAKPGAVHGLPAEFFARSGCLRQMSTKQFVAIVNYFLHNIWGSRFTVGSNHVDDIINILQKLQYPNQVNKSWLKAPNTQHSFGYVIQLFDFFMDFVPQQNEEQKNEMQFALQEPEMLLSQSASEDQLLQIPDAEFQAIMLGHSEEGFMLWDKQLMEEFAQLQQQTCDTLIAKRCGINGVEALDAELDELLERFETAKKEQPHISKEDEERCDQLETELNEIHKQLQLTRKEAEAMTAEVKKEYELQQLSKNEVTRLEKELEHIQHIVMKQTVSVEERDKLIDDMAQLKYTLQSQERICHELQDRLHHEQVMVSRTKKKLSDKIAKFNGHMREITLALLLPNGDELQLPLNPKLKDLETRATTLKQLHTNTQKYLQQASIEKQKLDKQINDLSQIIVTKLKPKCNKLTASLNAVEKNAQIYEENIQKQRNDLGSQLQNLEEREQSLRLEIKHYVALKTQKQEEMKKLSIENEKIMKSAEEEYHARANEREEYLNQYQKALELSKMGLLELERLIDKGHIQLQQLKGEELNLKNLKTENNY